MSSYLRCSVCPHWVPACDSQPADVAGFGLASGVCLWLTPHPGSLAHLSFWVRPVCSRISSLMHIGGFNKPPQSLSLVCIDFALLLWLMAAVGSGPLQRHAKAQCILVDSFTLELCHVCVSHSCSSLQLLVQTHLQLPSGSMRKCMPLKNNLFRASCFPVWLVPY